MWKFVGVENMEPINGIQPIDYTDEEFEQVCLDYAQSFHGEQGIPRDRLMAAAALKDSGHWVQIGAEQVGIMEEKPHDNG